MTRSLISSRRRLASRILQLRATLQSPKIKGARWPSPNAILRNRIRRDIALLTASLRQTYPTPSARITHTLLHHLAASTPQRLHPHP